MPIDTIPALFLDAVKTHRKADAFKYKRGGQYAQVSHEETLWQVENTCRGLIALRLAKGDRVAVLSENRFEWAVADLAILSASCINVPIYATLPSNQIEYILRDSESRAIFVSSGEQFDKIAAIRAGLPLLEHVIVLDSGSTVERTKTLEGLMAEGEALEDKTSYEERIATIGKEDWASIIYTSGTTGAPKGVVLDHGNFVSNAEASLRAIPVGPGDTCLSFLPLSHVFERTGGYYAMMWAGVTIAYAESIDTVAENMREVSPTVMVSVPRLYEKMYARILDTVTAGPTTKRNLFFWAVGVGKIYVKQLLEKRLTPAVRLKYKVATALVFRKLKARTGGKLRFFVSGGAPLAREIAEFFYAAGIPILEGYGLTETSPVTTVNTLDHFRFGTVGRPISGVDVRIAEDGEIIVRGPNVMHGYYKKPELTHEVLSNGWFHTGDIGYLDDDGFLTITDRKKDLIVTSGGKNVAPQPIESRLKTSKYVSQIVLVGNGRKFVSALVVPNFENLRAFAEAAGIDYSDDASLVKNDRVREKFHEEIEEKSVNLAGFERIKKFILLDKDFTIEANELTPTLKVKRATIEKKFKKEIDALYA